MMVRSFIAVEIPPEIQLAIARNTAALQQALPRPVVRWVSPQNIHLTLQFLGDILTANLEQLAEALRTEAAAHPAFAASVGDIGAFPTPRRARVLWVGLEAPACLVSLLRGVERVTTRMGYPPEARKFSPHLTIGRVNQNASAEDLQRIRVALEQARVATLGAFRVEAVHIFKSDLRPTGPVYTRLYSLPLTGERPSDSIPTR